MTSTRGQLPVIAIGGGLAGAAFALELARNGYRVIVLERSRGPRHTVCGEFLSEEAQVVLGWFGLNPVALGATTVTHLRLVKGERQATTLLPFKGNGLSRFRLDETLLGAAERAGAEVVRGALVTGVDSNSGGLSVRTQENVWKASAVALGTGKHPLRGFLRPASSMVGFKLHLDPTAAASEALTGIVQLVFFRGGYVGACLVEDGILSVAWVMQARLVRTVGADWERQSAFLKSQSSFIARLIARAQPTICKTRGDSFDPVRFPGYAAIATQCVRDWRSTRGRALFYRGRNGHCALQWTGSCAGPDGRSIRECLAARANRETATAVPSCRYSRQIARNSCDVRHRYCGEQVDATSC